MPADSPLAAIHAAPDDDAPRLVYADALAESGDPADVARAEFVRVQLALARLPAGHPRTGPLVARQTDLLQQYHAAWTAPVKGLVAGAEFRRGLLDAVSVDAGQFLAVGEELFRRLAIRRVRLLDVTRHLGRLVASPLLGRFPELDLAGTDLGNGGLHVLLRSPHLVSVESLDVSFNGLDDRGAARLAEADTIPALRHLTATDNRIGGPGATALALAPWYPHLHGLTVTANDITADGFRDLVARAGAGLASFRFEANPIGDDGLAAFLASPLPARLFDADPRLILKACRLSPASGECLAASAELSALVELDLSDNELDAVTAKTIAAATWPRLRKLSLARNRLDDAGGQALARGRIMKTLTHLDVSNNKLTAVAADELLAARRSPKVVVDLSGNFLEPEAVL
jgi:uncharacterized protein (TIGR02996 family)